MPVPHASDLGLFCFDISGSGFHSSFEALRGFAYLTKGQDELRAVSGL